MQLAVTFRHMDATSSLKDYAKEKVDRITKYFPDPIKAHVVLSMDGAYSHCADVVITLHNGFVIKGGETTEDMYSSIDLVMAKIERQVRRYKEKLRFRRPETIREGKEIRHLVVSEDAAEATPAEETPTTSFQIVREQSFVAQPLSAEEAVMQMNLMGNAFLVFLNADSNDVNVVYRRNDGTYGLIDPASGPASASTSAARMASGPSAAG